MQVFKDKTGDEWRIELTVGHQRILKARAGVDIFDSSMEWLTSLELDIDHMFTVIYLLVEDQIKERGLDEQAWCLRMDADAYVAGHDAFLKELEDFFLNARMTHLWKMVQQVRAKMRMAMEAAGEMIDRDANKVDGEIQRIFDDSSGSTPELSASIPDHSRYANSGGLSNPRWNGTGLIPEST